MSLVNAGTGFGVEALAVVRDGEQELSAVDGAGDADAVGGTVPDCVRGQLADDGQGRVGNGIVQQRPPDVEADRDVREGFQRFDGSRKGAGEIRLAVTERVRP